MQPCLTITAATTQKVYSYIMNKRLHGCSYQTYSTICKITIEIKKGRHVNFGQV